MLPWLSAEFYVPCTVCRFGKEKVVNWKLTSLSFQGTLQEVMAWGLLGWKLYANVNGPIQCKALSSLGVTQIVCSEKCFLILSSSGAVYTQNYKSTTLVSSVALVFSVLLMNSLLKNKREVFMFSCWLRLHTEWLSVFNRLLCLCTVWAPERLWSWPLIPMGSTTSPCHPMGRCSRGVVAMGAVLDMETPRKHQDKVSDL